MNTAQQTALDQAKQGNPEALAALMRKQLAEKGIQVRVSHNDDLLTVALASAQAPQKASSLNFVKNGLTNLGVNNVRAVQVQGYRLGTVEPVWTDIINLNNSAISSTATQACEPSNQLSDATHGATVSNICPQCGFEKTSKRTSKFSSCMACQHEWDHDKVEQIITRAYSITNVRINLVTSQGRLALKDTENLLAKADAVDKVKAKVENDIRVAKNGPGAAWMLVGLFCIVASIPISCVAGLVGFLFFFIIGVALTAVALMLNAACKRSIKKAAALAEHQGQQELQQSRMDYTNAVETFQRQFGSVSKI